MHHLLAIGRTNESKLNEFIGTTHADNIVQAVKDNNKIKAFLSAIPTPAARIEFNHHINMVAKSMAVSTKEYTNATKAVEAAESLLFRDQKIVNIPMREAEDRSILVPDKYSDDDIENAIKSLHNFLVFEGMNVMPTEGDQTPTATMTKYVNDTYLLYNGRADGFNIAYDGPWGPILVRDVDGKPIIKDFSYFAESQYASVVEMGGNRLNMLQAAMHGFYVGILNIERSVLGDIPSSVFIVGSKDERQRAHEREKIIADRQKEVATARARIVDDGDFVAENGTIDGTIFTMSKEDFIKLTGLSEEKTDRIYAINQQLITSFRLAKQEEGNTKDLKTVVSPPPIDSRIKNNPAMSGTSTSLGDTNSRTTNNPALSMSSSPAEKVKNLQKKLFNETAEVPIQGDTSPDTPPGPSIATVKMPMKAVPRSTPRVSPGPSQPKGTGKTMKPTPKKETPTLKNVLKGDFGGGSGEAEANSNNSLPGGIEKLSKAKLKNYALDNANSLRKSERAKLKTLLKKKGFKGDELTKFFSFGS
ncbi:MAG TPA: hypothetical protein EYQ21_07295 [Flavobacteriales bacterium]|nr:hypothetical protein [Flavobacteriales bacterium]